MKTPFNFNFVSAIALSSLLWCPVASHAQAEVQVKVDKNTQNQQAPGTVTISAAPTGTLKEPNPGVEFSPLGKEIARPPVRVPAGGQTILQVSGPLGKSGSESVLVNLYRRNDALFMDILTAKGKQVWTKRNTIRLLQPLPENPEAMTVTMRYLEPRKGRGLMIVASDPTMHYVLAFPKGLGGKVTQQQFLTTSKTGTQSTYQFGDLDGRGFAIVKGTVVSAAGDIKSGEAQQYFVWNGSRFIPRAYN